MSNSVHYSIDYDKENKIDFNKWWVGFKTTSLDFIFISTSNCVVSKSGLSHYMFYIKKYLPENEFSTKHKVQFQKLKGKPRWDWNMLSASNFCCHNQRNTSNSLYSDKQKRQRLLSLMLHTVNNVNNIINDVTLKL